MDATGREIDLVLSVDDEESATREARNSGLFVTRILLLDEQDEESSDGKTMGRKTVNRIEMLEFRCKALTYICIGMAILLFLSLYTR